MTGRLIWVSDGLYEACVDAWANSEPDAGTCEWAGDVAGAYESAPDDPAEVVLDALEAAGVHIIGVTTAVLVALGVPNP